MDWYRAYSEAPRDLKIQRLARRLNTPIATALGFWHVVLSLANDSPERGTLLISANVPVTNEDIAALSGLANVDEWMAALTDLGMVSQDKGTWTACNFNKRNFVSDDTNARVKRHREAKKQESGNASETLHFRYSNGSVTPPDTDTETKTDKRVRANAPPAGNAPATNGKTDKSPAVLLYHSTVKLWPNTTQEAAINRIVKDLAKWQLVVDAWRMRGIKPTNVDCLIDWYEHGIPEGKPNANAQRLPSATNGSSAPKPVDPNRPKIVPYSPKPK